MIPKNADTGELLGLAQDALGQVDDRELSQKDLEWVEEAYITLDDMVPKYQE